MATMTSSFFDSIYTYETLEGQPEQTIRVLTLNPGDTNLISCSLSNVRLNNSPSYKALSYVWGDKDCTKTIMIDGKIFPVRPNLWAFLDRFQRYHGTPACIWIDAICVNQDDIPERNNQVLLMSKIYTQAAAVYSWLDLGIEPQMHAWSDIMELIELGKTKFRARLMAREDVRTAFSAAYQTLVRLISNAYWKRAWIVQEVVLGQQVYLWYGSAGELNLDIIARIHTFLIKIYEIEHCAYKPLIAWNRDAFDREHCFNKLLKLKYMDLESGSLQKSGREPLQRLLQETSTTLCSDIRDKVYAFLNLASDSDRYGITPDYGKKPADLFHDLMTAEYNQTQFYEGGYFYGSIPGISLRRTLHLSYADLCANSRPKTLDESACKGFDTYAGLQANLIWILQREEPEPRSPVILVGSLFTVPRPVKYNDTAVCSVEYFLAALAAGLRGQRAELRQKSDFEKLLSRAETQDVFITFSQEAPVALYHFGHAEGLLPTDCMQKKANASVAAQGIVRYILDQDLPTWYTNSDSLTKKWNETVQRSLLRGISYKGRWILGHRHSTNKSRHCPNAEALRAGSGREQLACQCMGHSTA
jgi:hypothetical protein